MKKYGPAANARAHRACWPFGDLIFNVEVDAFFDVGKTRRFGFPEVTLDTGAEIVNLVQDLRRRKVIPG